MARSFGVRGSSTASWTPSSTVSSRSSVRRPPRRDAHEVAAAVGGIGVPLDEAAVGELVECGDHVAPVDAGVPSEVRLATRSVLVERGEQPVVVATEALGREPRGSNACDRALALLNSQVGRPATRSSDDMVRA